VSHSNVLRNEPLLSDLPPLSAQKNSSSRIFFVCTERICIRIVGSWRFHAIIKESALASRRAAKLKSQKQDGEPVVCRCSFSRAFFLSVPALR
jgi:hypothetical protein